MFELTNEQRRCFGLVPVAENWERIEVKASPYDQHQTFVFLEENKIVKCIVSGANLYYEYELSEFVSLDKKYLLPKTPKGKPTLLSSSTIQKRNGVGMRLNYSDKNVNLYNEITECSYFSNCYLQDNIKDLSSFSKWVEDWCDDTSVVDLEDINRFSQMTRKHIRYREGDVFRFKIGRRLYGYGRILLDYGKMRKNKEEFMDILMGKPLVCSVYHIVTEQGDISAEALKNVPCLPSTITMDYSLFYGEYEIIGNIPVTEEEDYPIMYGNTISAIQKGVFYQCGKVYLRNENGNAIFHNFRNNGVSFNLNFTLNVLLHCIEKSSNAPYWNEYYTHYVEQDLRNSKHEEKLKLLRRQFSL